MPLPKGVSQRDVAEHLGISVSTVSRALRKNSRVSQITRDAVISAGAELADNRVSNSTTTPLMLGVTHSHAYHGLQDHHNESVLDQVLGGVEVACRRYDAVPYPWQQSHLLSKPESDLFFSRVSGVIMSGGEIDDDVITSIRNHNKSIVIIGGHATGTDIPSVAADNLNGIYLATRHLIELGHTRIGLVNGPDTTYTSREKQSGYLSALVDHDVSFDPALLVAQNDRSGLSDDAAEQLTRQLLALDEPPTAIIFGTDLMARAGFRVCQERGLSVPANMSIIGFHDDDAAFTYPPMTSVKVNRYEWGIAAIDILMRVIRGEALPGTRLLLPVELVVRESTAPR